VISIASPTHTKKFSKVSALAYALHKVTIENAFENVLRIFCIL
jgi:hypothetical protein